MKLPFTFGVRLVFRWLAPGALLAVVFFPLAHLLKSIVPLPIGVELYFLGATLVLGSLVMFADMPIYMLYEGRRWWPKRLWKIGVALEQRRLDWLQRKGPSLTNCRSGRSFTRRCAILFARWRRRRIRRNPATIEDKIRVLQFPLSRDRLRYAAAPTRLGNLLAECENYPLIKYGMDGVFYWHRLWFEMDKDTREAIDDVQSVADGALYLSFASLVGAIVCLVYAAVQYTTGTIFYPSLGVPFYLIGFFVLLASFSGIYRASLHLQDHYAELFKAAFDTHHEKWDPNRAVHIVSDLVGDRSGLFSSRSTRNAIAWRFLRWDMYRMPGAERSQALKDLIERE